MVYGLIFLAALSRLLPHPPNFAPIGALGLFAGAYLPGRTAAWALPLFALLASDALIGFYSPVLMVFVYGSFALCGLLGRRFLSNKRSAPIRLAACSLASALLFFVLSNLGIWVTGSYGYTAEGLLRCYVMALPFFRNTLLGDLFYTAALFGTFEGVRWWVTRRRHTALSGGAAAA